MVLKLEDGKIWYKSELLAGNTTDYKGTQLNFSAVPGTNNVSYLATSSLGDNTGRNFEFRFDDLTGNSQLVRVMQAVK